jgi:hypothetical protein
MDPGLIGEAAGLEGNFTGFDGICRYRIDLNISYAFCLKPALIVFHQQTPGFAGSIARFPVVSPALPGSESRISRAIPGFAPW